MNKILIRAGISPLEQFNAAKMIVRNTIGGNVGNLIYQFGVFSTISSNNTKVVPDYYGVDRGRITEYNVKDINKKYSAYICPLADAFREDFMKTLIAYTKIIKKLDIPFIVPGVGLRTGIKNNKNFEFSFDNDVHDFISSVIDSGSILGVRGSTTGKYLHELGFIEGKDFMIIGCPSMFSFGNNIKIRENKIDLNSKISINSSLRSQKSVLKFIINRTKEFPNYYFIPQWQTEFILSYLGNGKLKGNKDLYPIDMKSNTYKNNHVRFPISASGWIKFLRNVDLSFGARLHGNIAATIAGTPSIMIIKDGRMEEVANYHNLTGVRLVQLEKFNSLSELIENVDFHAPEKGHEERFKSYLNFWKKNGIETVFDNDFNRENTPLSEKLESKSSIKPIETISNLPKRDISKRFDKLRNEKIKWKIKKESIEFNNKVTRLKLQPSLKSKISYIFKFINHNL